MNEKREAKRQFIEDVGDMMVEHSLPHMSGRVLGALLVCVPPYMAMDELAEELQASKGSISTATQLLLRLGLIEKISRSGHRRHYFQILPNPWSSIVEQSTAHLEDHRALAEKGLAVLQGESSEMKQRLAEMQAYFDFIAEELPGLIARWEKRQKELFG